MAQRQTRQRTAIRAAIDEAARPLSPEEVLDAAKPTVPSLSIATVYRALRTLQESGFIRPVAIPDQPPRYERAGLDHHHHFFCRECDRVFDVPGCPSNVENLAPKGFTVDGHDIVLFGTCRGCDA